MRPMVVLILSMVLMSCSGSGPAGPDSAEAKAYRERAAAQPGAVKTASGLIYRELRSGSGASPTPSDSVKVHYRGTLIDGIEFDSSYKRNEPAEFPLDRVIPCWTEGLQRMKIGGKSQLVCPSAIAYGESGSPPMIPGGATLVFEIELLGVSGH
jgi:FKBP-type peptidyl-prolyl cis-trans isomerase FkpA